MGKVLQFDKGSRSAIRFLEGLLEDIKNNEFDQVAVVACAKDKIFTAWSEECGKEPFAVLGGLHHLTELYHHELIMQILEPEVS